MTTDIIVQTHNLTKRYGNQFVVNDINLQIKKGEIYGFLGPNGAGKTTTIKMLLGLNKPTSGKITIFNRSLEKNKFTILKQIGSLVESPSYYGHLTGQENLELLRRIMHLEKDRVEEILKMVRLYKAKDKLVKEYSLGMKQRLGIAQALLGKPELLILDEPTNGLDPEGIQETRELIKSLPQQYGMTILISSHLLNEIEQMATSVGIIQEGHLIFQGSIKTLHDKNRKKILFKVNDIASAIEILTNNKINFHVQQEGLLIDTAENNTIGYINNLLVKHQISVYRIEEEKKGSLEQIFLDLTVKGEKNERSLCL